MHLTIVVIILAAFGWTWLPHEQREPSSLDDSEELGASIALKSER
jgi:hypothetical protein